MTYTTAKSRAYCYSIFTEMQMEDKNEQPEMTDKMQQSRSNKQPSINNDT